LGGHDCNRLLYFSDDGTEYAVQKYGKIIALTWEALVNDNLGAFLRVQPALGQAARRLEADLVYSLFALNSGAGPAMQDGTNLFQINHATSSRRARSTPRSSAQGARSSAGRRRWVVATSRSSRDS
jgi:phage major head subunit gpT-like protein